MFIKGILHERTQDAPFIGALVIANNCSNNCIGCFNQHLKEAPPIDISATAIIEEVMNNPFNTGVILSGLEWSEQPEDLVELCTEAKLHNLEIIIYTHMQCNEFEMQFKEILPGCYVKYGEYREDLKVDGYYSHGVKLATSNQVIKKY